MTDKLSVLNPEILPISEDYGWRLAALDPTSNQELYPVSEAIFEAYQKIAYALSLKSGIFWDGDRKKIIDKQCS